MGKRLACRIGAWLLALALIAVLVPEKGRAVLEDVYFTAANEKLMDLNSETMPFYSGGVLYVSSKLFDKTDLGVTYVYNSSTGLAMLYTPRTDLRFDVANQTTYDKNGNYYQAHAIDKGGNIFLPMGTVCGFFGLSWSISDESQTGIAPLIRVRSSSAILSDRDFIDAASGEMRRRYEAYEKQQSENTSDEEEEDQPSYPVYSGQKIHLLVESQSREDTLAVMEELGQEAQAAFLLTTEQMEMYQVYRQTLGNKPLLFGGGSPDTSGSEDLSGVQFINGTRPGNPELVELAKSQVGNVGGYPYWSWYGFNSRVEWCACFVSWCYNQAGKSEPRFAGCEWEGVPWFQSRGQWGARGYENIAPGDAIFFDWDLDGTADHVGIVIGTDGSRVYTVEGNSGDACKIKSYDLNYQSIKGYGLMNW